MPDAFDMGRVVAHQEVVDLPDHGGNGAIRHLGRGGNFTPATDAFVGRHFEEEIFAQKVPSA